MLNFGPKCCKNKGVWLLAHVCIVSEEQISPLTTGLVSLIVGLTPTYFLSVVPLSIPFLPNEFLSLVLFIIFDSPIFLINLTFVGFR